MRPDTQNATDAPTRKLAPSVLVLTWNEEQNIAECLENLLTFSDDVVVLDSESTDRTVDIARSYANVRVLTRRFDTEWRQRNYGLHEVGYHHPWVYICDADERVPSELAEELRVISRDASASHAAYRLRYKNMFMGRWLKRGGIYPVWIMRLVRPDRVSYEQRQTNVHPIVDGTIGELSGNFVHYSFNKGLVPWLSKHNSYSQMEAAEARRVVSKSLVDYVRGAFKGDRSSRRRSLKNLSFFIPARAFFRFMHMYVLKRGFLDGPAGFHYAAMISMYEYWIGVKVAELEQRQWAEPNRKLVERLTAEPVKRAAVAEFGRQRISVMIPTFNEAAHIAEAVQNARELGEVFVLDSMSKDGTQNLARAAGATVVERAFTNYSDQKNWGLDHLPFTGDWIFILDADERLTPSLRNEILEKVHLRRGVNGYFVNRVVIMMGKQVRHGGLFPSWNLRLFKRGMARYEERVVHEHMVCSGHVEFLHHEMLHLRRESIHRFIEKHIRYADMESGEWLRWKRGQSKMGKSGSLFKNALAVRQWVRRNVWPRLPGRPLWRFLYMYFFRFGFLDGLAGWHMARLMACYEYMIGLLYQEKLRSEGKK